MTSQRQSLTVQKARGISDDALLASRFADRKHLYAKLPAELRTEDAQPDTQMVVEACKKIGGDPDHILEACHHDSKGWIMRCSEVTTAEFLDGKMANTSNWNIQMVPYMM